MNTICCVHDVSKYPTMRVTTTYVEAIVNATYLSTNFVSGTRCLLPCSKVENVAIPWCLLDCYHLAHNLVLNKVLTR